MGQNIHLVGQATLLMGQDTLQDTLLVGQDTHVVA